MNRIEDEMLTENLRMRIAKRVVPSGKSDCHWWVGQEQRGRGYVFILKKQYAVNRLIYALSGKRIRHHAKVYTTCGHSSCVNPDHLRQEWEDYEPSQLTPSRLCCI